MAGNDSTRFNGLIRMLMKQFKDEGSTMPGGEAVTSLTFRSHQADPWHSATFEGHFHRIELSLITDTPRPGRSIAAVVRWLDRAVQESGGCILVDFQFREARSRPFNAEGPRSTQTETLLLFHAQTLLDAGSTGDA